MGIWIVLHEFGGWFPPGGRAAWTAHILWRQSWGRLCGEVPPVAVDVVIFMNLPDGAVKSGLTRVASSAMLQPAR